MDILYIIAIIILLILSIILIIKIHTLKKDILVKHENKLILFVFDMYLTYGDSLDIFPSEKDKKILISKIKELESKIKNKIKDE